MAESSMGSRQRLGQELRKLRLLAGMSGQELAARIGITQARVSRIETAAYRPAPDVVRSWLTATSASPELRDELLDLVGEAQVDVKSWRAVFRGSMAGRQHALVAQDAAAARIRHFQPFMVPGFLHTREYAEAALRAAALRPVAADIDAAVVARLARGVRLRASERPPYSVVLTELALRWTPLGLGTEHRLAQMAQVLAAVESSPVDIRVIPADAPMTQAPMSAFVIYDYSDGSPSTVDVELPGVELRFAGTEEIAAWTTAWERMAAASQSPEDSAGTIRRLMGKIREEKGSHHV